MDQSVKYTISIEDTEAHAKLDSLIAKAERLTSLLEQINNIDEEIEVVESVAKQTPPKVVFTVGVGDIFQLLNAPANGFSDEFREQIEQFAITHLRAIKREKTEEKPKSDTTKYKASKIYQA